MKSKFVSTVIALLTVLSVLAQNGTIKGKIIDSSTKEPLIGAAAMIKGTTIGSASDLDGNFSITNLKPGVYAISSSYISYKPFEKTNVVVKDGQETVINIELESSNITLQEVVLVAKSNRESENILLMEQKQSVLATQAIGAKEMSRKGISNAEGAVAQISGVSKQNGVKNVFVRGLGDRNNFTTLNGFPLPSEDPEYKNISLDFFGSDIIQNVGVKKVFAGSNYSDVTGAVIDITSRELVGEKELSVDLSAGGNSSALKADFYKPDGVDFFGNSLSIKPADYKTQYNYGNSLEPHLVKMPANFGLGFTGGRRLQLAGNPLTFYLVGSYSTDYSYTKSKILDTNDSGVEYKNFTGEKSSQNINQLVLANISYLMSHKHQLNYNFMLVHDNTQFVGNYLGKSDSFEAGQADAYNYLGFMRAQQTNDNLLLVNQLMMSLKAGNNVTIETGVSYNMVRGSEPDRRVNNLFKVSDTEYQLMPGDGPHIRNYNILNENDFNGRFVAKYKFAPKFTGDLSALTVGYNGRFLRDDFEADEYSLKVLNLTGKSTLKDLNLDKWFNQANYDNGKIIGEARISTYNVSKFINAGFVNFDYQFNQRLTVNAGLRAEYINLDINFDVKGGNNDKGSNTLNPFYILPSVNVKYDLNTKNAIRLGLSKTYTLPQSKEVSPYLYQGLNYSDMGNPNLISSDNYNADLKWDYYPGTSELISLNGFFKYIQNPIARIYKFNAAGYYTFDNISDHALVAGLEMELRKNILNLNNSTKETSNKLSAGLNASYIYSSLNVNVTGRESALEGAAPYIFNFDLTYDLSAKNTSFTNAFTLSYVSDKIHSIGVGGFNNVIEKAAPVLNFTSAYSAGKHLTLKLKAKNLLDPSFELTRKINTTGEVKVLNSYKKGMDISLGISYKF